MAITNGYATLSEVKAYLSIPDALDDTVLEQMTEAASRTIDKIANRRFYLDTNASARLYRVTNPICLFVDDIGSTTGLVVKTDDDGDGTYETTLTLNTDYLLDPLNANQLGRPWTQLTRLDYDEFPIPLNYRPGVQVTAKWGWPTVPDDINQACLILVADLFKRKDAPGGIVGLAELGTIRLSPLGRDIAAMVKPYRRLVLA
jgi:hypothetical protein